MIIPGFLISILTFPGVIVHELAHQFFCRITGTAVLDVCYFRVGNPAGYVVHETPASTGKHFLISVAPFFVNTLVGALIAAPASLAIFKFGDPDPLDGLLGWLGVSIAMHAFPSTGDARSLWSSLGKTGTPLWIKILIAPIVALIFLGAVGSFVWLDALYGIAIAAGLPHLLVEWLK